MADELKDLKPEELLERLKAAESKNAELEKVVSEQDGVVSELKAQVELKKEVAAPVSVTIDKKTYRFAAPHFFVPADHIGEESTRYTAEEAAADKALCKNLLKIKSGILIEVK